MITFFKIAFFGSLLAAVALFGACYLNPGAAGRQSGIAGADAILEKTYSQVSTFVRGVVRQAPARLHMSSAGTGTGIDSTIESARLQLDGMRNSLAASLGGNFNWLRPSSSSLAEATQNATAGAENMARKVPVVSGLRSNMNRLADLHPTFSASQAGF